MKFGIIIETKDAEKSWNGFRLAETAKKQGHAVKVFLMGEAVECERITHAKYDTPKQMRAFLDADGEILACGTCLKSRHMDASETCPISTMVDCVSMVAWADRVITF